MKGQNVAVDGRAWFIGRHRLGPVLMTEGEECGGRDGGRKGEVGSY